MQEIPRSHRCASKAERIGDVPDSRPIRLTVVLRPGAALPDHRDSAQPMPRAEFRERFAARQEAVGALTQHATFHDLRVDSADAGAHVVRLSGTYGQARAAFQPDSLSLYKVEGRELVAREGALRVPDEIAEDVVAVLGFDERPVAHPRIRPAARGSSGYLPAAVAQRYGFPTNLDGTGQTIALIELGGGYDDEDVSDYFTRTQVKRTGRLVSVGVSGGRNGGAYDPDGANGEVQLDIEVAGSVAPAANLAVYFAPNQGSGFFDAIHAAVHDQTNDPSVISISWGGPEDTWSSQDIAAMEQVLVSAATLGITVCVASGDDGAGDGEPGRHADYPASSPHTLGCGGTRLPQSGPEVVWNDGPKAGAGGGCFSAVFATPSWQKAAVAAYANGSTPSPHRGVPDVSGNADPETGYEVSIDGRDAVAGGTSAVAPLWAGLIALANQRAGRRLGFVNPALYANPAAFNDITSGNNNGFAAGKGWDAVTGMGSPKAAAVIAALTGSAGA